MSLCIQRDNSTMVTATGYGCSKLKRTLFINVFGFLNL